LRHTARRPTTASRLKTVRTKIRVKKNPLARANTGAQRNGEAEDGEQIRIEAVDTNGRSSATGAADFEPRRTLC